MSEIAIRVQHLGKRYRIGQREPYKALRDVISGAAAGALRRLVPAGRAGVAASAERRDFWALKDVSFEVRRGEVIGVIGRNGAGKSTLLKILSRITKPTEGRAEIRGRVGSLLEVGTGFHPELTGRENIYLNGAILGMRRAEIARKFDEIVAFAEVEKFLDTPVKRYSSGMHVRLAFSVAAHLEPEILLVDEVLAVGDAQFQKKCLGKMGQVATAGRTILFVSHNMEAIQALCQRAIWVNAGRIVHTGASRSVVSSYLNSTLSTVGQMDRHWLDASTAPSAQEVRLVRVYAKPSGSPDRVGQPVVSEELRLGVDFWCSYPQNLAIVLHVVAQNRLLAFATSTMQSEKLRSNILDKGLYRAECVIPGDLLNSGVYSVRVIVTKNNSLTLLVAEDVISFEMHPAPEHWGPYLGDERGVLAPLLPWELTRLG